MTTAKVKVHCGNAHVKGNARNYFVASLFTTRQTVDGRTIYVNSGKYVGPFRSKAKANREGRILAESEGAEFVAGYGSLHNQEIPREPEPFVMEPQAGQFQFDAEGKFFSAN